VDLAPYNPERDVPYFSQQFIQAEPPEVSRSRPRPDRLLSQGALGPRKALTEDVGYVARYGGACPHGEQCPCQLCLAGRCQEGTCLPSDTGAAKGLEVEAVRSLESAALTMASAVASLGVTVSRFLALVG
jgi:hypothetical protein